MKPNTHAHDGTDPGREPIGEETVGLVLEFQRTGEGFEGVWNQVGPTVERMVRGRLLKRDVRGPFGGADEDAVQESTQQVSVQLWELPGKSPQAWFDPAKGGGGVDGLRAWLYGFCRTNVARYCTQWRNAGVGRRKKVITQAALPLNEQSELKSIVKSAVAKFDPSSDPGDRELRQIMNELTNEAVESLDDDLQTLVRLHRWDGLSERQIADRLTIHVSSVHRRLKRAEKLVERYLEVRGFKAGWLTEAA